MRCHACQRELADVGVGVLRLTIEILGDEVSYTWVRCGSCRAWTEEVLRERFAGPEERETRGPIPDSAMAELVALVPRCPRSWDPDCACPAHRHLRHE